MIISLLGEVSSVVSEDAWWLENDKKAQIEWKDYVTYMQDILTQACARKIRTEVSLIISDLNEKHISVHAAAVQIVKLDYEVVIQNRERKQG